VAAVLSLRFFCHLRVFPSYAGKSAFPWEDKQWWWRHRTDVKHDAVIFLSSSLFQSTCICQTGVLFCCVSTLALKRYAAVSNRRRRRRLRIPVWEHDADDFCYNSVSASRILQMEQPTCLLTPLTLQNFLTFGSHFIAFLFSWFLREKSLNFRQKYIIC